MFAYLGRFVTRCWAVVLAAWAVALIALLLLAPSISSVRSQDDSAILSEAVPSKQAVDAILSDFEKPPGVSTVSIVMERPAGLTGSHPGDAKSPDAKGDWDYIARLTARLRKLADQANPKWSLMSPSDPGQEFLRGILVSHDNQAAVVTIDLPTGFAARDTFHAVDSVEQAVADAGPPVGPDGKVLDVAVTGSASYGRDANSASEISLKRTTWVCIIAVILILLITYRALPAAVISLATVSLAVVVAVSIVAIGGAHGWSISMLVEVFTIVIGYGAGVDFSLFFLSRYHEELGRGNGSVTRLGRRAALIRALAGTGPAIVASAGTVAAGLSLMYFAKFRVFHTAGPAVAISIALACLASLTITPVMAHLAGSWTFWPRHISPASAGANPPGVLWNRVASFTVRFKTMILVLGLIVLVPLAAFGWQQPKVYDTLSDLPSTYASVRGADVFQRHFPVGQMAPVKVAVRTDKPLSGGDWAEIAEAVDTAMAKRGDVQDVRSLLHPVGVHHPPDARLDKVDKLIQGKSKLTGLQLAIAFLQSGARSSSGGKLTGPQMGLAFLRMDATYRKEALPRYLGSGQQDEGKWRAALWEVAIDAPPYTNRAMDTIEPLREAIKRAVESVPAAKDSHPTVFIAGDTAQMADLRQVTNHDFWFVGALVVAAVVVIVTLLIRDVLVALFVMVSTILTYGAALGITGWAFHQAFGTVGLDWRVNFSLFVILVAVGQDYNLFMLTRIIEERRRQPLGPAVQSAVARTGSIISYCGLIMAATLGSLASSPLRLLQELGVAFIVGLLIDTFLVRPLLVPAFILVFRRLNRER